MYLYISFPVRISIVMNRESWILTNCNNFILYRTQKSHTTWSRYITFVYTIAALDIMALFRSFFRFQRKKLFILVISFEIFLCLLVFFSCKLQTPLFFLTQKWFAKIQYLCVWERRDANVIFNSCCDCCCWWWLSNVDAFFSLDDFLYLFTQ